MLLIKPVETELTQRFRLSHGSRYQSMNVLKKIECSEDYTKLVSELKSMSYADLLKSTFMRHMNAEQFDRSGSFLKSFLF